MRTWLTVADRTAVLFLGVAAGAAIGYAFGAADAPAPRAVVASDSPPPPNGPAGAGSQAMPNGQIAMNGMPPADPAVEAAQQLAGPAGLGLVDTLREGQKVRVGVFGDSYGDGIWSALYHLLPAKAGFEVVKYSRQSTGFTRYGSLNLETHVREQLAANPVNIAVVSFGANDTQGVLVGNHAAKLLGPEWQEVVGKRVEGFVNELRAKGASVYWVGLPKMRKPEFDADIAGMNAFYARKMRELGVPWIETASMTVDAAGAFSPYLPDGPDNERTLIRANDGIHMSMTGYVRITRGLSQRIRDQVSMARRMAGVPDPAAPAPAPPAARPVAGVPS